MTGSAGLLATMMGFTALAKLLGLLRSARIAALLGVGWEADALTAAKQIPTLLFDLFLAALPSCLIPVYCRRETPKTGLARCTLLFAVLCGVLAALLCTGTADSWLPMLFPKLSPKSYEAVRQLLPLFAFSLPLMAGVAVLNALCQCERRFLRPAVAGCLANGVVLLLLGLIPSASSLVIALLLGFGCLLQGVTVLPVLQSYQKGPLLAGISPMIKTFRLLPSSLLSSWLLPCSLACAMTVASRVEGGAARLDYAFTFYSAVLGILVSGIINYNFPRLAALRNSSMQRRESGRTAVLLLSITLPVSLFLCFLSPHILAVFYRHGRFTDHDTKAVAQLLSALALSLPFCALEELLRRIALLSAQRRAAYLPPLLGGMTAVVLSMPFLGLRSAAVPFFVAHGVASLSGCLLLPKELGQTILSRLPSLLMGCASVCIVYTAAKHFLPSPFQFSVPFMLTVSLGGSLAYLTVCRVRCGKKGVFSLYG